MIPLYAYKKVKLAQQIVKRQIAVVIRPVPGVDRNPHVIAHNLMSAIQDLIDANINYREEMKNE